VLLAANGGLRGVPRAEVLDVVWGDQGYYRFGAGAEVASDTYVSLDLTGAVTIATLTDPKIAGVPIEVLLGGHRKLVNDITVRGGIGTGLTNGISAPAFRAVLALDYAPGQPAAPKDTDGDGFIDSEDSCPDQPEDVDSYNDTDGCPDPSAAVTLKAVDAEGNPVAGATLSLWSGGTQVSLADLAVHEPTSFVAKAAGDGFESGEVEVEVVPSDGDKVVTITLTAIPEPPIVEPEVVVKAERIDLKDQVHFASGTAQLRTASHKVLDRVAELMALHTNILVLRIEGHTDATGSDESNQTLSQARAQTVMAYLIKKGVSGDRLVAKGHGESKLLDQDETEVAHEKNRRVEMYVETWAEE
jgi:outer membrane protein OmpA-like peptidoglycan-associated protein